MELDDSGLIPGDSTAAGAEWDATMQFPLATAAEASQIVAMREQLKGDLDGAACSAWPDITGDVRFLRFLRGYDHSVEQAVVAVRDMLRIRALYGCDELHAEWADKGCTDDIRWPHQDAIDKHIPGLATAGISPTGHVITYIPIGRHDVRAFFKEKTEDE